MEFPRNLLISELSSPPSFKLDSQLIEYREDPLTHVPCRINTNRTRRLKPLQEEADISQIIQPDDCPFCPQNIERRTPLFPEKIFAQGRIKRGNCYLFPNLFPFAQYHATGTLTSQHFLKLDQFEAGMIVDSLIATQEYLLWVYGGDREARYPLYIWNHLPPSAASIIHPHVQILVDSRPTAYQQRLLESSKHYFINHGRNFWEDIIDEERKRWERYIGGNECLSVIASYAPQGNREVQIIFREASNLLDLEESQRDDFAHWIIKILRCYKEMGINSFNLSTFSGPIREKLNYYSLNAKIISRPPIQPFYRNDTGFLERFHYESDIEIEPEVVAQRMKAFLK